MEILDYLHFFDITLSFIPQIQKLITKTKA